MALWGFTIGPLTLVVSCQITLPQLSDIHLLALTLGTFTFIFNSCALCHWKIINRDSWLIIIKWNKTLIIVSNIRLMSQIWGLLISYHWSGSQDLGVYQSSQFSSLSVQWAYSLKLLLCFTFTTHWSTAPLATRTDILSHCTCNGNLRAVSARVLNQLWLSGCLPHSSYSNILHCDVNQKWQEKNWTCRKGLFSIASFSLTFNEKYMCELIECCI